MEVNRIKPFLHKLVGPKLFTLHATVLIALRTTCYGYLSGILTTLERRFQLSSSEAGSLLAVNDLSELLLIVIVAHFAHKSHRPRWIGIGSVIMSVGMLISAIPHFSSEPLDPEAVLLGINAAGDDFGSLGDVGLCSSRYPEFDSSLNGSETEYVPDRGFTSSCGEDSGRLGSVAWIVVGQMLVGFGSAPTFPLIMSYLDDSVDKVKFTSYTGMFEIILGGWRITIAKSNIVIGLRL